MKRKVIIDLNGVIFRPVEEQFGKIARRDYGPVRGAMVYAAYKYGIGRRHMSEEVSRVLYRCVCEAKLREGVLDALDKIVEMPHVSVEFCSQIAFPWQKKALEGRLRALAPCMNAATHYELISPYESKRDYLYNTTGADKNSINYVVDDKAHDFNWPSRWRSCPVLIYASSREKNATRGRYSTRDFHDLKMFADFLDHQR